MVLWHQIKRVFDALKFLTFATNRGVTAALTKMTALAETLTGKRFKLFTKTIQNLCQVQEGVGLNSLITYTERDFQDFMEDNLHLRLLTFCL
jgi:hypothetical protein